MHIYSVVDCHVVDCLVKVEAMPVYMYIW